MDIFGRKAPPLQVGDRFRKSGDRFGKVWQVSRLWVTCDGILHSRLRSASETRIISAVTLVDPDFFTPAPVETERQ